MRHLSAILALWAGITACAQAAEPITLGLNYPRTGPYKEEGLAQMRGALLAIDEINAQGGVLGRPLRLSSKDTAPGGPGITPMPGSTTTHSSPGPGART